MMNNRKNRTRLCILLTGGLLAAVIGFRQPVFRSEARDTHATLADIYDDDGVFGYVRFHDNSGEKHRNPAKKQADSSSVPYQNSEVDKLGQVMSDQLNAAFGSGIGTRADIQSVSAEELSQLNADLNRASSGNWNFTDIRSKITFQIPRASFPASALDSSTSLFYLEQAISRFPKLCCLFTLADLTLDSSYATFLVYSPIAKDELRTITLQYENTLNEILLVIKNNPSMTETDKLLYLHDEIVAMTEYSTGRTGIYALDCTPVGSLIYNLAVCQSYAAVFNQAALSAGLTSYVLDSSSHAWNAVLLGDKWYYIDTTWDDTRPTGQGKDYVKHDYLLVNDAVDANFTAMHTLTTLYSSQFSGLTSQLGNAFQSFFPKERKITSQMGYLGGLFYFSENNSIKSWDRGSTVNTYSNIPSASARRVAVANRLLYVSGSDGLYQSNADITALNKVDNTAFVGMYEAANRLYVSTGGSYYIYYDASTPVTSAQPNPGTSLSPLITPYPLNPSGSANPSGSPTATYGKIPTVPPISTGSSSPSPTAPTSSFSPNPGTTTIPFTSATPTPTATATSGETSNQDNADFTPPPQTTIKKIKNKKSRSVFVKWKKVKGSSRYQIQYSTSKNFSTKQMRDSLTNSVKIVNLYKNKTYFFRVRAVKIRRIDGVIRYRYAPWSSRKKKLIKI